MDWLIGVLLLIVGAVIGFFVAKFWLKDAGQANANARKQVENIREVLNQQAQSHLSETRQLVDYIQQHCDSLNERMDAYEQLFEQQDNESTQARLDYFGEQASLLLRNKQSSQRRQPTKTESQPRDFSAESSGLFSGVKQKKSDEMQP